MSQHLTEQQLIGYIHQTLTDAEREVIDRYLPLCPTCRARLADHETLQRRIDNNLSTNLRAARSLPRKNFAVIAPRVKRSRRIQMFAKRSNQVVYGTVTLVLLIVLGIGLIYFFGGLSQSDLDTTIKQQAASPIIDTPTRTATLTGAEKEALESTLIEAVRADDQAEVQRLLEAGADANVESLSGPIIVAAAVRGNADIVALLIDHGADIEAQNNDGLTPIVEAARNGHLAVVELLLDRGVDVNAKDGSRLEETALFIAAGCNYVEISQLLIDRGADVNLGDALGAAPLHHAASRNSVDVADLLIAHGANIDLQSNADYTPLHEAVVGNNPDAVKLLIDAGAALNFENNVGRTPMDYAVADGYDEIAQLLYEAGAEESE